MPDTERAWQIATLITDSDLLKKVQDEIMTPEFSLLKKSGVTLWSSGLRKEAKKQAHWREKSSIGGTHSANARRNKRLQTQGWLQNGTNQTSTKGQPKGNTPTPTPTPIPILKKDKSVSGPKTPLAEDNKLPFGDMGNVYLTQEEHSKLVKKVGGARELEFWLQKLSGSLLNSKKTYKSHYACWASWGRDWWLEKGKRLFESTLSVDEQQLRQIPLITEAELEARG